MVKNGILNNVARCALRTAHVLLWIAVYRIVNILYSPCLLVTNGLKIANIQTFPIYSFILLFIQQSTAYRLHKNKIQFSETVFDVLQNHEGERLALLRGCM